MAKQNYPGRKYRVGMIERIDAFTDEEDFTHTPLWPGPALGEFETFALDAQDRAEPALTGDLQMTLAGELVIRFNDDGMCSAWKVNLQETLHHILRAKLSEKQHGKDVGFLYCPECGGYAARVSPPADPSETSFTYICDDCPELGETVYWTWDGPTVTRSASMEAGHGE